MPTFGKFEGILAAYWIEMTVHTILKMLLNRIAFAQEFERDLEDDDEKI